MKHRKISAKIMRAILLVNLISLIIVGSVVGVMLHSNIGDESRKAAEIQISSSINRFEQDFSDIEAAVSVMVNSVIADVDVNQALADKQYLQDYKKEVVHRAKVGRVR